MRRLRYLFTTLHLYTSVQRRFNSLLIILYNISYNIILIILTTKTYFKNYICNSAYFIYYIAIIFSLSYFLEIWIPKFFNKRTHRFCLVLPILGITTVYITDIRTRYFKKKYGNGRTDPVV